MIKESLRDSAYNDGKFFSDIVCFDSIFIETKEAEKDFISEKNTNNYSVKQECEPWTSVII